jgi:hypothetical protein
MSKKKKRRKETFVTVHSKCCLWVLDSLHKRCHCNYQSILLSSYICYCSTNSSNLLVMYSSILVLSTTHCVTRSTGNLQMWSQIKWGKTIQKFTLSGRNPEFPRGFAETHPYGTNRGNEG